MLNTHLRLTLTMPFRLAHCWLLLPLLLPAAQARHLDRLQSSNIAHLVASMDSISLHKVQSSSSSSELAAPIAHQTPTHTFNLNLTRDQYADLIESLQCFNQQGQSQQPSLIALGRQIDAQLHTQQRTSLHPHCQAQAVPHQTFIDTYRMQQIQWLKKLSQCLALFHCLWHSITICPNKAKVSVCEREHYIMATYQIKNYVIRCCIHRDIANSVWWLIGTVIWVGIRNAENTEFSTLYCLPWH